MNILKRIDQALKQRSTVKDVELMIEGDHWLDGRGWVGPKFKEGSSGAVEALAEIKRQFVSKNTLNEICKRHRDSVTGQEPQWGTGVTRPLDEDEDLTEQEQALIFEADQLLTNWFDRREIYREFQDAVKTLLWARIDGRQSVSALRLYLPDTELDDDGQLPTGLTPAEITSKISLKHITPQQCGVMVDGHGNEVAGFYAYKQDVDDETEATEQRLELSILWRHLRRLDPALTKAIAPHLSEEPEDEDCVLAVLKWGSGADGEPQVLEAVSYPLNGRTLIHEMSREPLVAPSVVSLQKQQNLALTMLSHNVVQGGFLERTILNGARPGRWVNSQGKEVSPDEAGPDDVFMPEPMAVGAGATNFIMGEPIYDSETGEITGYTSPNMIFRDPVPVATFRDTAEEARHGIYQEVSQYHVLIAGDATTSGASRRQAADDFVGSLAPTAREVQMAFAWMIETLLAWSAYLTGQQGRYDQLKAVVKPRLTAVQPTSDELRLVIEQYNAGLFSQETAMSRSGIEDTDAELAAIQSELERDMEWRGRPLPGELDEEDDQDEDGQGEGEGE